MKIALYLILIIFILVVITVSVIIIRKFLLLKAAKNGKPLNFKNAVELMQFIRLYFDCKKQSYVALYGFVEFVVLDDATARMGLEEEPHLSVDVHLISDKGHEKITAICLNTDANLKRGDFVAVLPVYNERHNIWAFTLVSKLKPLFLGGDNGFLIEEKYI
ncbi:MULTISPECIES: hypothetical protein [Acinetobacter]|uniref:Uncharacterized protein n=1 Tax=Acinetobacter higginsii TaxID=70347 RepID=N9SYP2_9GAMM|nr:MULTISPECIES: hypothetical protein [Acinetobacter]ENX56185.1 hypothetical protein F902_03282 [Acinetobacter higginsii]